MNYWKQFAEMLGLELGEKFELTYDDGTIDEDTYKIEEDGFYYKQKQSKDWLAEPSTTVNKLINGYCKVVPKQWKPKYGERYWYYSTLSRKTFYLMREDGLDDLLLWKAGNCFKTREEAEIKGKEIMEQIQKEYEES